MSEKLNFTTSIRVKGVLYKLFELLLNIQSGWILAPVIGKSHEISIIRVPRPSEMAEQFVKVANLF